MTASMSSMGTLGEILGVLATGMSIVGALFGAGMFLVKAYFKKANELQALRDKQQKENVQSLANELLTMKSAAYNFQRELDNFRHQLAAHGVELKNFERMSALVQSQWEAVARDLKEKYQALDGAEVVKVGANTFVFKTQKR